MDPDEGFTRTSGTDVSRLVGDATKGGKMSAPVSARQKILDRVRGATQSVAKGPGELESAYAALPRSYVRAGKLSGEDRIALMIERLREYDAEVVECAPDEVPAAIDITTNDVTLDLNGFTISSTETTPTGFGIKLSRSDGNNDITIFNGHIKGGVTNNAGVYSGPGFASGIDHVSPPLNVRVTGVSVSGCSYYGIYLGTRNSTGRKSV